MPRQEHCDYCHVKMRPGPETSFSVGGEDVYLCKQCQREVLEIAIANEQQRRRQAGYRR